MSIFEEIISFCIDKKDSEFMTGLSLKYGRENLVLAALSIINWIRNDYAILNKESLSIPKAHRYYEAIQALIRSKDGLHNYLEFEDGIIKFNHELSNDDISEVISMVSKCYQPKVRRVSK